MSTTKVITGKVRLSYVHLFETWAAPGTDQEPSYSTVLLIPKSDTATVKKLRDAQKAALEAGKDKAFGGSIPKTWKDTIHDGDEEADLERNPEYAGHLYMTVGSKQTRPGVVDQNVQPILDTTEVYSGCYARVSMDAFAYNQSGTKGVSFWLRNVQKLADGEPLGNVSKPEDDFADSVDDGSGLI